MTNRRRYTALAALALASALVTTSPSSASNDAARPLEEIDYSAPVSARPAGIAAVGTQGVLDDDPHHIVPYLPFVQRYSLDTDHLEVWLCGDTGLTMNQAIASLEAATVEYFDAMSHGRYGIEYTAGGAIPDDPHCLSGFETGTYATVGSPEGIVILDSITGGGFASPGIVCSADPTCSWIGSTFPDNGRYAVIGADALTDFHMVAAHELGHTLQWPHSNSGQAEYDNPIDLMSGNLSPGGWTYSEPYATLSYNRYQSGWVDPGDVIVAGAAYQQVVLQPFNASGTQLLVIPTNQEGVFYVLGARTRSTYDPIPAAWEGVEVYLVNHDCGTAGFGDICPGIFREQITQPPNPGGVEHVLQPGESMAIYGIEVEVLDRNGTGFTVAVGDPARALPFADIYSSPFVDDILWLVDQSITKGCNPPANTKYCAGASVTRGEMAAFLSRTLRLTGDGGGNHFIDDDGSIFENDIAKLAAAGITKGCNPPDNTMFCPDDRVTREQMAAFLVRAYGLSDDGGGNQYTDDDGSVFENDIARLAAAGITKGCNPPANTMFCPYSAVTREQMAAFLHRATKV